MRLKLDENLGTRGLELLQQANHDVITTGQQGLNSASDATLIAACRAERRCLVTLDTGFANPLRFPPRDYAGIAVIRLPTAATQAGLDAAITTLIVELAQRDIEGRLWVVRRGRIREYAGQEP